MRTVLIGMGAIGGTVATLINEAGFNMDVCDLGAEKIKQLREEGFRLTGARGEHKVKMNAFEGAENLEGEYDICIIASKYQAMPAIAKSMLPHLKKDSLVVCMQNGICVKMLAEVVGAERACGCMIGFGATNMGQNWVEMSSLGEFYIGMLPGQKNDKLEYLQKMLNAVLPTEICDNIEGRLYSKLIINSCINAIAGITGKPLGQLVDDRIACTIFLMVAREGMNVAKKMGIKVPKYGKLLEYRLLMLMDNKPYNRLCEDIVILVSKKNYKDVKPSTLQSLEKGQKTEIDIMNGLISSFGKEYGVPTPVNDKLTAMIKEIENGEREITMKNLDYFRK